MAGWRKLDIEQNCANFFKGLTCFFSFTLLPEPYAQLSAKSLVSSCVGRKKKRKEKKGRNSSVESSEI